MPTVAIRQVAIVEDPPILVAGFFKSSVQIWSWMSGELLGQFETILDYGGRRLALTRDGRACIAGSWRNGLAAYSLSDGRVLWHRRDIHQVQKVTLNACGSMIYCGLEKPLVEVIETESGESIDRIAKADSVFASLVSPDELISRRGGSYLVRGNDNFEIPATSFALLAAAFSRKEVCISEAKPGIRCVDLTSGLERRRIETIGANHLSFNSTDGNFYLAGGLENESDALIRLAPDLTDCVPIAKLKNSLECAFSPGGNFFATNAGDVYETSVGKVRIHLDFPTTDTSRTGNPNLLELPKIGSTALL